MADLKLTIETDADLGTRQRAEGVLGVLCGGRFAPERFGEHEPLRGKFDPAHPGPLIEAWLGKAIRPDYWTGTVFLRRKKAVPYFATIRWVRGQAKMNVLTLTVPQKSVSAKVVKEVLNLGRDLFEAVDGQFGYVCDRMEYLTKNVSGWWEHPETGRVQGGRHLGTDRSQHLPGLYWANFFGTSYVDFFSESRLKAAPTWSGERLPGGSWLLLTAAAPEHWESPETALIETQVREHLGDDAFFDIGNPDRRTVAPKLRFTRTLGGRRGGVTASPVAATYLRAPQDAQWFISNVLQLVSRLRSRLSEHVLDLTSESLEHLDRWAIDQGAAASPDDRSLVIEMAAYYGEVLRRAVGGRWRLKRDAPEVPVVELPGQSADDPFVRVVKLLQDGTSLCGWQELILRGGETSLE